MRKMSPATARLSACTLLAMTQSASAQSTGWGMFDNGHMWNGMGYGWGHGLVWLLLIVFGVLVYRLARDRGDTRSPSADPTWTALQILNERYARGEIDKAEYEEKKAALLTSPR